MLQVGHCGRPGRSSRHPEQCEHSGQYQINDGKEWIALVQWSIGDVHRQCTDSVEEAQNASGHKELRRRAEVHVILLDACGTVRTVAQINQTCVAEVERILNRIDTLLEN